MDLSLRSRLGVALAAVVVVSVLAQAAMIVVEENESTEQVRGERFDLSSPLHVSESRIDVVPADEDAVGTAADPLELAAEDPRGHTSLQRDHWMYTVVLEEQTAQALASGHFEVELLVSGDGMANEPVGSVYVGQENATSDVEGAELSWDLGSELPENPLFVLKTYPHTPSEGPTREVTLQSEYDAVDGYVWRGVGGAIDGQQNPSITVEPGTTVTFTIRHGCDDSDTAPHNFALSNGDGDRVAVSDDVSSCGDETEVTWTAPDAETTFSYQCDYHPDTMQGTIQVSASDDGGDGSSLLTAEEDAGVRASGA